MRARFVIGLVLVSCVLLMWLITRLYQELLTAYEQSGTLAEAEYSWFFRLLLNLMGYATILLPGFILYKYLHKTNYFDKITNQTYVSRLLTTCFGPHPERLPETKPRETADSREGLELAFCFVGLMGAYLVWGLLQEKIMTQSYLLPDGSSTRFSDSQFLVFANRLAALVAAAVWLRARREPALPPPLYEFSYCALSNVLSAWCQYEALKYVSFPTQVLSKSCKLIPVMLMGKLISRNKYSTHEYVTAVLMSVGMVLFMFGSHDDYSASAATSTSGALLLALYMACDSFTSSWQGAVFAARGGACSPLQMLCAVNVFSCALTAAALAHRGRATTLALLQNPVFVSDCAVLSASSALGQLLIYRTIARFGAVVFTIIMTLRQAVSILLSCAVYGHAVSVGGACGVALVLGAVLLRLHGRRARAPL